MRLWIKNPLGIVAEQAAGGVVADGSVIVELVPAGGAPSLPVDEVFDASQHVVLPGLINTHHHFYQTLTRAHPAAIDRELFPWLKALYPLWARLNPDDLRLAVRVALTELLLSGCTTAADHHYLFPKGLESAVDIAVDEARALGIRMTVSRGSMNLSQKDGGLPPDEVVQDEDTILADSERVLSLFHDPRPGSMIQIALAPCSPFSVTPSLMAKSAELAGRFDAPLHTHLAETQDEDAYCLEVYGKRPLDLLEETGWMRPKTWLAHGIHFSCEECERLGKAGVGVCHCPSSNGVLASGFCKTRELEAAGSPLGLGVDGSASNDGSNLMEELRHALLINRLHYRSAAAVTARDVIRWATEGSARCLGRSDIGTIAPGMQADFALYKLDELRFSGAHDPVAALVLCGANRADRVMVGGRWRVVDGAVPGLDVAALRRAHGLAARRYA
ncbi:8-oxoguanine deaminase [Bosea caraganae]|uniref:8-oxoguanine deaminase n=1 Tax=Bosea caraganae TaxID=2763117 RepID=A0A370L7Y0_9HYPH|nr:8-oxoguanine deaminase [Bosea caraganae]RDJ25163.1 8-oxoguanine deaminase [Bosea caraganae]RDJ26273.1 8-oxoguanine deaminase [Bosea caraganae]